MHLPFSAGLGYPFSMTTLLDHAVDAVRALPPAEQDDIARLLLQLAGEQQTAIDLAPAEAASFGDSLAQASRGERATADQVRGVWAKHGL
jgi:hypothetical protein